MGKRAAAALIAGIVLAGGASGQIGWRERVVVGPSAREAAAAAFDVVRDDVLLFGGRDLAGAVLGDTWKWDGARWSSVAAPGGPPARRGHALALDPQRARIVLFGGVGASGVSLGDTWEWDGVGWSSVNVAGPSARSSHALATAAGVGGVLLFGGADGAGNALGDTWRFDGGSWTPLASTPSPSARFAHAMCLDSGRDRVVMFGGRGAGSDTWEHAGSTWMRIVGVGTPSPRARHVMVCDELRERVVLVGGATATAFAAQETWEWDGSAWSRRALAAEPPPRLDGALVFDPARERTLLFGGLDALRPRGDTWSYGTDAPARATDFGSGCAGTNGTPHLTGDATRPPWLGSIGELELDGLGAGELPVVIGGFSKSASGTLPLPFSLAPLGMPGCFLLVSQEAIALAANRSGRATLPLALPADASLAGAEVHFQSVVWSPGANALGVIVSNAVTWKLGLR